MRQNFKRIRIYKKHQKDNLKQKNTTSEINNSLHGLHSRLYTVKTRFIGSNIAQLKMSKEEKRQWKEESKKTM